MFTNGRPAFLAAACVALAFPACSKQQTQSSSTLPQATASDTDRPAMPPHRQQGQSATAGDVMYEPAARAAPPSSNLPGSGTAPGTTKALAPAQGTLTRSTAQPSEYQLHQGTNNNDLKVTQAIHHALQNDDRLPADGAAITVITHGGNAVLLGTVATEAERDIVEQLASYHAASIESHIVVGETDE